jgi:hypothetical protein
MEEEDNIIEFGYLGDSYRKVGHSDCYNIAFDTVDYGEYVVRFVVAFNKDGKRLLQVPDYKCDFIKFGELK